MEKKEDSRKSGKSRPITIAKESHASRKETRSVADSEDSDSIEVEHDFSSNSEKEIARGDNFQHVVSPNPTEVQPSTSSTTRDSINSSSASANSNTLGTPPTPPALPPPTVERQNHDGALAHQLLHGHHSYGQPSNNYHQWNNNINQWNHQNWYPREHEGFDLENRPYYYPL